MSGVSGLVGGRAPAAQHFSSAGSYRLGLKAVGLLLPFAAGYLLSYVFRTINAVISGPISSELGLTPADLGLLTSVYFLGMAVVQLPLGTLLDHYGPHRVQTVLLLIAAGGALLFANTVSLGGLMLGRLLIGIGFATSLLAGLKAIVLWLPRDQVAAANGTLIAMGALGAVAATGLAQQLVDANGWRTLIAALAVLTALSAAALYALAPAAQIPQSRRGQPDPATFRSIYTDRRFWRLAPLSATCIGSAWAIQGLWAGPWLIDVEGYDREMVVRCLLVMAVALSLSAAALGQLASTLRRNGVSTEALMSATAAVSILAQIALVLRWPVPPVVLSSSGLRPPQLCSATLSCQDISRFMHRLALTPPSTCCICALLSACNGRSVS